MTLEDLHLEDVNLGAEDEPPNLKKTASPSRSYSKASGSPMLSHWDHLPAGVPDTFRPIIAGRSRCTSSAASLLEERSLTSEPSAWCPSLGDDSWQGTPLAYYRTQLYTQACEDHEVKRRQQRLRRLSSELSLPASCTGSARSSSRMSSTPTATSRASSGAWTCSPVSPHLAELSERMHTSPTMSWTASSWRGQDHASSSPHHRTCLAPANGFGTFFPAPVG